MFAIDFQRRAARRDLREACIDEADAVVAEIERYIIGIRHVVRADDFAVEGSRTACALLAGGGGEAVDGFGGAHDARHFVQRVDAHVEQRSRARFVEPRRIGGAVLEIFGPAVGGDAFDGEDAADAAVADDLFRHEHVRRDHVDGHAAEFDMVLLGDFDLLRQILHGERGGLLAEKVLSGGEDRLVDVVVGGNGGGVDRDVEIAFFDEFLNGTVPFLRAEAFAGGFRDVCADIADRCQHGICGFRDVRQILSSSEAAAADDGDFPGRVLFHIGSLFSG